MRSLFLPALLAFASAGCGAAPAPVASPNQPASPSSAAAPAASDAPPAGNDPSAEAEPSGPPTACDGGSSSPCVMPKAYVKRLCSGVYPDLALLFFEKDTPWTRAYVAVREAEPYNGLSGPSSDQKLLFDEELLVLAERKPDLGGMTVSGVGSSYDLLRWDGTCVTLSAQEVRLQRPPKPGNADITWRHFEDATQNALLEDERVAKAVTARHKECKGATMGEVSAKCEKADRALKQSVVDAVRGGRKIPPPSKQP